MATLSDLMKESEKLKFRLLQQKMLQAPSYLNAWYFKQRADWVLYRAERRIMREGKTKLKHR